MLIAIPFLLLGLSFKLLLILLLVVCRTAAGKEVIHRINYGTVFRQLPDMFATTEYWTHTFVINMHDPSNLQVFHPCDCPNYQPIMDELAAINNHSHYLLNDAHTHILSILPQTPNHSNPSRSRRSLLPFVGNIAKSLFGTATSDDLQRVASFASRIRTAHLKLQAQFQHEVGILASFMQTTNHRLDNAVKLISLTRQEILDTTENIRHSMHAFQKGFSSLMAISFNHIMQHSIVQKFASDLLNGFISLNNGNLSPLIITNNDLHTAILRIQTLLQQHRPMYK